MRIRTQTGSWRLPSAHRVARPRRAAAWILLLAGWCGGRLGVAQEAPSEQGDSLQGVVLNSVTREPVARALVSSPDSHFATMTDTQGHFALKLPSLGDAANRPTALFPRKPGYITDISQNSQLDIATKEMTLTLTPEAMIVGHVSLGSAEAADKMDVEIYRRQVQMQDGRGQWISAGQTTSRSNGEFRFADLPAGTYKLMTHEQLDLDQPVAAPDTAQLFGYAPVYFPEAKDFAGSEIITLAAGQTFEADLSVTRQPYYPVKVAVTNVSAVGVAVSVSPAASLGPGYALGYNQQTHTIEGLLPSGVYSLRAFGFAAPLTAGELSFTVHDAPYVTGKMTLVPAQSISINVKKEFSTPDETETEESTGPVVQLRGLRRYLNVTLEPADDFAQQGAVGLRPPTNHNDESLVVDGVAPGRYRVSLETSRGYASSVMSGGVDLLRQPLVVGDGSSSPIEITLRDDSAQIEGKVEGADPALSAGNILAASMLGVNPPGARTIFAYVYFVPLPDSSGKFAEVPVAPDGTFTSPELPPATYRVLAFKRPATDLEYRNPEAMRAYEAQGQVVQLTGGQKEHVTLQLVTKGE